MPLVPIQFEADVMGFTPGDSGQVAVRVLAHGETLGVVQVEQRPTDHEYLVAHRAVFLALVNPSAMGAGDDPSLLPDAPQPEPEPEKVPATQPAKKTAAKRGRPKKASAT